MLVSNLNEIIDVLKPRLPEYLQSHGINPNKKFKCISPEHDDDIPSCRVNTKENSEYARCFGCGQNFDIFTAASWLENMPTEGADWIQDNVLVLANKYKLEVDLGELTEREKYIAAITRAYSEASRYISNTDTGEWTEKVSKYTESRGWTRQFMSEMGIGVGSREGLITHMMQAGYSSEYLREINLVTDEAQVIEEGRLIFTMYDRSGKPVGFIARTFGEPMKYINTTNAGLKYSLPNKGETLYGIHLAKKYARSKPLYIFEGNGDVLSAHVTGLPNCCAVQGAVLSEAQLKLIQKLGFKNLILALDFDVRGQEATEKILTELPETQDLYISVLKAPEGDQSDPGAYLEQFGLKAFRNLQVVSAFSWLLHRKLEKKSDAREIAADLIPVVASEPNAITRELYLRELSEASDISIHALELEVNKIIDEAVRRLDVEERSIISEAYTEMDKYPEERISILSRTVRQIEELKDKYTAGKFSSSSCVALLDDSRKHGDLADPQSIVGFELPLLPELAQAFEGGKDWSKDTLMILGGPENTGKSSYMAYKTLNIAAADANDALTLYFSIDDSAADMLPKFVAAANCFNRGIVDATPDTELLIGAVINPKNWSRLKDLTNAQYESLIKRRKDSYDLIRNLMLNERLIIKDASDGSNLDYMESAVRYYRSRYPSKKIFAVLDNTHNLSDYSGGRFDMREKYTRIGDRLKNIATRYHICLMASVEYRKLQAGRGSIKSGNKWFPSNDDIAETRTFKYRAQWIGHIYSDMHAKPDDYDTFHVHPITGAHMPRIILLHGKTKINEFKGKSVLDFFPGQSAFRWVDESTALVEATKYLAARQETKENGDDENW